MPYINWHSARIQQPGRFIRIRVLWSNQGIMAYGGPLKSNPRGGSKIQSIRFKASKWTVSRAKKWLREHKHKWIEFEKATG
jgi:hypothetical protein